MKTADTMAYYASYLSRVMPDNSSKVRWALLQLEEFMPPTASNPSVSAAPDKAESD